MKFKVRVKIMVRSFISPKIWIQKSKIHGVGMFAIHPIAKSEIVFIHGGHIVTRDKLFYSAIIGSYLPLDDNYFIGAIKKSEEKYVELFLNHSCNPNCGIRGEITFAALRDIIIGEELTIDYAMVDNEEYRFKCNCNSSCCRNEITGFDWKIVDLQKKYKGFFARYLSDKMETK